MLSVIFAVMYSSVSCHCCDTATEYIFMLLCCHTVVQTGVLQSPVSCVDVAQLWCSNHCKHIHGYQSKLAKTFFENSLNTS